MLVGSLPFASSIEPTDIVDDGDKSRPLYKVIVSRLTLPKKPFVFPKDMSIDAEPLIRSMLRVNPSDRADLEEVACHRWLCNKSELTTPDPG
jgi:serine/threonine protein kinase